MESSPRNTTEVVDRLAETARRHERVSIGQMMDTFGHRSYGPFLLVPALIELSPIGGIPGVPTFLAAIVALFAGQMLLGRDHFWIPEFVSRQSVSARKLGEATQSMRAFAHRLDRLFHGRLTRYASGPFVRVAAFICIVMTLTVPPLELIPFASSAPMGAIALIGLALLVCDGALMIAATGLAAVALVVTASIFTPAL
ncbi:exopolysaccharide biosynthesis protein [Afifella sp. YEN Y35]|uniref:exopolysaccharide biosynthesis protein n=1 Tax=Afifella sp. YEN Y35 TaxID=3388337 RepID=UPI0039E0853B